MGPSLADRLRGIVNVPIVAPEAIGRGSPIYSPRGRCDPTRTANALGGIVRERPEGATVVVDRRYAANRSHGRARMGDIVETLLDGQDAFETLSIAWPSKTTRSVTSEYLFLDLETTGLAGGAGTVAFLVGCAVIENGELLIRQFLLPGFEHEAALLAEVNAWAGDGRTLVTFNGRSFDVPLIETRYLFHRLDVPLAGAPHVDMLHPSRGLWKQRPSIAGPPLDEDQCKLAVLERHLAGVHRVGDVPGFEMPSRFFRFVRDGNPAPLEAVLEHNRIDLLSLALVTARALRLIEQGPSATTHPRECVGLGRLYERAGLADHAEASYAHAASLAARIGREPDVRADALRRLALCRRRTARMAEAADAWNQIVALSGCPAAVRREAREALAIHHEHRSRDLKTARRFVLDTLAENPVPRWREQAEHRLRRIERKLAVREQGGLIAALESS